MIFVRFFNSRCGVYNSSPTWQNALRYSARRKLDHLAMSVASRYKRSKGVRVWGARGWERRELGDDESSNHLPRGKLKNGVTEKFGVWWIWIWWVWWKSGENERRQVTHEIVLSFPKFGSNHFRSGFFFENKNFGVVGKIAKNRRGNGEVVRCSGDTSNSSREWAKWRSNGIAEVWNKKVSGLGIQASKAFRNSQRGRRQFLM